LADEGAVIVTLDGIAPAAVEVNVVAVPLGHGDEELELKQ